MKTPLYAVYEDDWIELKGDPYADPTGSDPTCEEPLRVYRRRDGRPTNRDQLDAFYVRFLGELSEEDDEELGISLIVSPHDGARTTLLYFPNSQHEVTVCEDCEDVEDDENEDD